MLFIFVQGLFFVLPVSLLGLNFISVIIGSILLGLSTLFLGLLIDYLTFGKVVIDAYFNAISKFLVWAHLTSITVWQCVWGIIFLKIFFSLLVSLTYTVDFKNLLEKLKNKIIIKKNENEDLEIKSLSWKESLVLSLKDLGNMKFLFSFIFVALMIYFFSHLTNVVFTTTLIRGLILAWLGFFMARRIDFYKIMLFLEKHDLGYVALSLKQAMHLILKK